MPIPVQPARTSGRKLSLSTLLITLVTLVAVMTTTIVLAASYQSKRKSLVETTLNLNLANAERMSLTADSLFRSMRSSLLYSAKIISGMKPVQHAEISAYLELMRNSSNYFNSVILAGPDGEVLNSSPETLDLDGKRLTSPAALEALRLKKSYISPPYVSATTGKLLVFMSEPLFDKKGLYLGQLGGSIYLQDYNILSMIYGNSNIDDSGSYFFVVSEEGHLVFHPDQSRLNEDVSANPFVQKLMRGESGRMEALNLSGADMLAGYSGVPSSGWGVAVVSPVSVIQEQINGHLRKIAGLMLLPFALLLISVIILAHRLAYPFAALANLVSRFGKEDVALPQLKPHWNREVDLLTKALSLAWKDIQQQTDQLTQEAMTDQLTGLANRRGMEWSANQWISAGVPFSLIVLDIDKFKFVNDNYGHLAGDEVLRWVGSIIAESVRPGDICCRFGGEEFVVLLPRARNALAAAERIRSTLDQRKGPLQLRVTSSLGIAHFPVHGETLEELLGSADEALYTAKRKGRNCTVVAGNEA
ncbi:sensor domain-containing diguanylate cyclase [Paenibacillus tengchongensis]|uniref:sensor domain-containing diguanylate cyclase n=1 Tax=Paenibacillus tengchongensis TaxID=2608684 RepID=UPI00124EB34D|nr:sensor domain-containing diguanylate cyclase [Paenibacillus tengchongensis]